MTPQKYVFQFVNHNNGERSEPLVANYDQLKQTLEHNQEKIDQDHYVLLVAVIDPDNKQGMTIPRTPLMKISTLLATYAKTQEVK